MQFSRFDEKGSFRLTKAINITVEKNNKIYMFETMPIPQAVSKLCIPTILSSLVMIFYNLADTFFVGALNDAIQSSGVTLAAPVLLAFNAVNNLFGVGTSSKMSRALGQKDYETVYRSSAFGFFSALICSVLFSVFCTVFHAPLMTLLGADSSTSAATGEYLFWTVTCGAVPAILNVVLAYLVRAEGAAIHASIGTMSGCILNIFLDPLFILEKGLGMGAAGAGLATFLSNCVACLYFFIFLFVKRGKTYVCIDPRKISIRKDIIKDIFSVGIPASIQNLLNVTGMTVLNNFTASFDSAAATAAMGICHKISMVPMYISNGLSQGIMPLISYNFACNNIKRMKEALLFTVKISMTIIVILSVLLIVFSAPVVQVFLNDKEVIFYGKEFLRGMAAALPFLCFDFVGVAVFQACGMGGKSLAFAILRKIVLEIPALFLLNSLFPLFGLAWAQFIAEFLLATAAAAVLWKMFRRLEKEKFYAPNLRNSS